MNTTTNTSTQPTPLVGLPLGAESGSGALEGLGQSQDGAPVSAPIDFDSILEVVRLARRLAKEDYSRHLAAVVVATDAPSKALAVAAFRLSERAAGLADAAYVQVVSSEGDFRRAALETMSGNSAAANDAFTSSGARMESAAAKIEGIAAYIPKSAFFLAAVAAVQKAEKVVTSAEAIAVNKFDAVSRSLSTFAGKMMDFGRRIAQVPEKAAFRAMEKATTVMDATIEILMDPKAGFVTAVRATDKALHSPWDTLEALDYVDSHLRAATRMVSKVATDAGQEVGSMLSRMLGRLSATYTANLKEVEADKQIGRFVRDLSKIEPIVNFDAPASPAVPSAGPVVFQDVAAEIDVTAYDRPRV